MFTNVNVTGYSDAENGWWVHFTDEFGRARHARLGSVYPITVDGKTYLVESIGADLP